MEFEKDNLNWIEYDLFKNRPVMLAKSYLRHGGVSEDEYKSLNLSSNVSDSFESVKVNREVIKKDLNVDKLVFANQVHSDIVVEITQDNISNSIDCDAIATKEKNIALCITHADCQAALFFDSENEVIAAAHAGYKGLIKNIYKNTVDFMVGEYHSKPENILVAISPCLCLKHSEFKEYEKEFPKELYKYKNDKNLFDLRQIAIDQLVNCNIKPDNIEIAKDCTYCNEDFFSYRRDGKKTGRLASVICLK